jgi:hypothetical protein
MSARASSGRRPKLRNHVRLSAATAGLAVNRDCEGVGAAGLARLYWRDLLPLSTLGLGTAALMLGVAMLLSVNFALSGQFAWTPGGYGIVFARMMQDGIVARYLGDHCPDPRLRLCPYRYKFPSTADEFLWKDGPFKELGGFAGLGDEMRAIVLGSLAEYPVQQIEAAAVARPSNSSRSRVARACSPRSGTPTALLSTT